MNKTIQYKCDHIIVMATPLESQGLFESLSVPLIYTHLGKVNAAVQLTRALCQYSPKKVFNFGTAGSFTLLKHTLVECNQFLQKDMDLTALGIPLGTTPFEKDSKILSTPRLFTHLPSVTCATSDTLTLNNISTSLKYDVMDMEAYALAKACKFMNTEFSAIKFITDNSTQEIKSEWQTSLPLAAKSLFEFYQKFIV